MLALIAGIMFAVLPAAAQGNAPPPESAATVKQITNDLYFFFDFNGSNSVFLVTDVGVLVIDARVHPRNGQDLLDRIRKVTDKPIKWVINSHFHGDHTFGNAVFKTAGATFVAQKETARIMQQVQSKEMARRVDSFRGRGYDPNEVKLILPDVTFDSEMTIRLGGREGARRLTLEVTRRQAYTSAMQRVSTGDFTKRVSTPGAFNPGIYDSQLTTGQGGLPIKAGDDTIGGIAAAGAPVAVRVIN